MKARFFLLRASCQNSSEFNIYAFMDDINPVASLANIGLRGIGTSPSTYTIYFRTRNASTGATEVDVTASFPSIATVNYRDIMIEYNPGVDAKLYLNGSLIATITTNLPDSADTTTQIRGLGLRTQADGSGNAMTLEIQNAHGYIAL